MYVGANLTLKAGFMKLSWLKVHFLIVILLKIENWWGMRKVHFTHLYHGLKVSRV